MPHQKTQNSRMGKKTWPIYMLSTRHPPQNKRSSQTENEWMAKIFQANGHEKKAELAILVSDKIDFKKKGP